LDHTPAPGYHVSPQDLVARGLTPELAVFLTSMLPIVELRGALPLAINLFHMPWIKAFIIAFIGNVVPVPIILLLLGPIANLLSKIRIFSRFFTWMFEHTRKKSDRMIEKYEEIGLMVFVAIPLPVPEYGPGLSSRSYSGWNSRNPFSPLPVVCSSQGL